MKQYIGINLKGGNAQEQDVRKENGRKGGDSDR